MSDSDKPSDVNQPRQPRNLQGLLKFAMEGEKVRISQDSKIYNNNNQNNLEISKF